MQEVKSPHIEAFFHNVVDEQQHYIMMFITNIISDRYPLVCVDHQHIRRPIARILIATR